jgi:hypothetical protein
MTHKRNIYQNIRKSKSGVSNSVYVGKATIDKLSKAISFIFLEYIKKTVDNKIHNKTVGDIVLPVVKSKSARKHKRNHKSFSARKIRKMLRTIKKEPDNELRKLMEKTVQNVKASRSKGIGRFNSKIKTCFLNQKISLLNYHNLDKAPPQK